MASKNEKQHVSRSILWPFWLAGRLAAGLVFLYIVSMVCVIGYAVQGEDTPKYELPSSLVSYYVNVASNPQGADQFGEVLHDWVFIKSGLKTRLTRPTFSKTLEGSQLKQAQVREARKLIYLELWEKATYLFGVRLKLVMMVIPVFALMLFLGASDGWIQRSIRKACGGHESASIYHRAKMLSTTLLPPLAAAVFMCSPWAYDPLLLFIPATLGTALLMRLQATYYKKYL
jgi:integrating conjugative element membrane protein (TIGR03747 family)